MNVAKYTVPIFASFLGLMVDVNVASASTITYDGLDVTNPRYIAVTQVRDGAPITPDPLILLVGQIVLHGSGSDAGKNFAVWCLDPIPDVPASGVYNITSPLPLTWAGGPSLTQSQVNQITSLMYNGSLVINSDPAASAAIQLAIWQVEFGPFFHFVAENDVISLAATYIGYVDGGIWSSSDNTSYLLTSLSNADGQAVGYATPPAGPGETPLPSTIILFGSVLGAGYYGLRRYGSKVSARPALA